VQAGLFRCAIFSNYQLCRFCEVQVTRANDCMHSQLCYNCDICNCLGTGVRGGGSLIHDTTPVGGESQLKTKREKKWESKHPKLTLNSPNHANEQNVNILFPLWFARAEIQKVPHESASERERKAPRRQGSKT
jgi:hypothetical protein